MKHPYATHLPGPEADVLDVIRDACTNILRSFGYDGPGSSPCYQEFARIAGFLVTYFGGEPGTIVRSDGTAWNTPSGAEDDEMQHVLSISFDGQVACFGWRGDGPIVVDILRRGLWEFALLRIAGLSLPSSAGIARPAPIAPEPMGLWILEGTLDLVDRNRRLSRPLTLSVNRYDRCSCRFADAGTDFGHLLKLILECHIATELADDECILHTQHPSCYVLQAWRNRQLESSWPGAGRPDLRYFIGSENSLMTGADLLLAFDRRKQSSTKSFGLMTDYAARPIETSSTIH